MFRDLSQTLGAMLGDPGLAATLPELAAAQIVFDRPTNQFKPTQTTIDLFLYDIRENVDLRSNEPIVERRERQASIRRPAMRVACSYLITAWPVGGTELALQEHRLLSQAAQVVSQNATIPQAFLRGKLVGQQPPLPLLALATEGPKNPAEFWSALGSNLRASLTATATIGMEVFAPQTAPIVTSESLRLEQLGSPGSREEIFRIGGQVIGAGNAPVAGAAVRLAERGLAATTDANGRYTLSPVTAGAYTLRVQFHATVREVSITVPPPSDRNYNVQLP